MVWYCKTENWVKCDRLKVWGIDKWTDEWTDEYMDGCMGGFDRFLKYTHGKEKKRLIRLNF